ncbi:MAG TPA: hypothetical protein PKM63_14785 [Panacibacter sp.]|nr:hypothetical protein [Panacibacter sp.]HNP45554.1 hypothetical protein [Panacibacter sp.]
MKTAYSFISAILFLFSLSCRENITDDNLQQQVLQLRDSLNCYRLQVDSTDRTIVADSSLINSFFGKHDIAKLRMHGLKKAPQQIVDSLLNRTDLIPYKAGLGGTMRFWNIQLIKTQWAVAEFTDGHVAGELLLSYKLKEDRGIEWTLLDANLE